MAPGNDLLIRIDNERVSKPTVISLFSGAGGLDFGFEAAGFRTAVAVEMDADCCRTLRRNRTWRVIEQSIHDTPSKQILREAGLRKGEVDVLIGGPPCQPFSKAGYWARGDSARLNDPRALTLSAFLRVLEDTKPRTFLLENVEGLAFGKKNEGLESLLSAVQDINARTGTRYSPQYKILNAADFGVPQLRERFVMVGSRDGTAFRFPDATHSFSRAAGTELHCTCWDAIGDLDVAGTDEELTLRGKWADLLPSIPEGQNYLFHTDRGEGLPLFGWRRRYWNFLLKLAKSQPSWTLQAQPGPATGPFHWRNRMLSMRELCRLQTFPDDVVITGSRTAIQRQVGNAVPSLLAEVLAKEIRRQLLGQRPTKQLQLSVSKRPGLPPPERPTSVPKKFRQLKGHHEAHPGTGKGYRAVRWGFTPLAAGREETLPVLAR